MMDKDRSCFMLAKLRVWMTCSASPEHLLTLGVLKAALASNTACHADGQTVNKLHYSALMQQPQPETGHGVSCTWQWWLRCEA